MSVDKYKLIDLPKILDLRGNFTRFRRKPRALPGDECVLGYPPKLVGDAAICRACRATVSVGGCASAGFAEVERGATGYARGGSTPQNSQNIVAPRRRHSQFPRTLVMIH